MSFKTAATKADQNSSLSTAALTGCQTTPCMAGNWPSVPHQETFSAAILGLSLADRATTFARHAAACRLTVIIETPDKLGGEHEYSTIRALGDEVAACATLYYWPKEHRAVSDSNKPGLLHVKCAVADVEWLFLSSANLTQQAFTINMELGMLIRGGTMPTRVEQQFEGLVGSGELRAV